MPLLTRVGSQVPVILQLAPALDPASIASLKILGRHLKSPRHFVPPGRVMNKME